MQVRDTLHAVRGGDRDLFPAVSYSAHACLNISIQALRIIASGAQHYCNVRPELLRTALKKYCNLRLELLRRALKSTATDAENYCIRALRTTV